MAASMKIRPAVALYLCLSAQWPQTPRNWACNKYGERNETGDSALQPEEERRGDENRGGDSRQVEMELVAAAPGPTYTGEAFGDR